MDYLEWCEHVLGVYAKGARDSINVRRDGLRPEQVVDVLFGATAMNQAGRGGDMRYQGLHQAIRDLNDLGLIRSDDDHWGDEQKTPGKITDDGEQFLNDKEERWDTWRTICTVAPELKAQYHELMELVNCVSPREGASYAWMEWIHQDTLASELGWDVELLSLVVQEMRYYYGNYVLPYPNFYPLEKMLPNEISVRATYEGLVLQTKRHLTIEAREIDKLVEEWETTSVDFKRELRTKTKDEKAEFAKDILGLVNTQASGKRWLILGFDDKSRSYHSAPDPNLSQDHLEQILAAYTDPPVEIRYDVVEHYQGPVGRVRVLRDPAKLPYAVARSVGDKKRVREGQIFVRHGSQTEEPTSRELAALHAEGENTRSKLG